MSTVLTGAIALVKVNGKAVGKMRGIRANENIRRQPVRGIGTIMPSEQAVTEWEGTLSCDFMEVKFQDTGLPNAIRRDIPVARSQVLLGNESFEDQLILDVDGVQVDIFKKVTDLIDPTTGLIRPKLEPYAIIKRVLIESDSFDISDGAISGHSQSFKYLDPVIFNK